MRETNVVAVDRLDVACELIDRALRLYYERDSYFATLHLAGAAEEILGVYAEKKCGVQSSFSSFRSVAARIAKYFGGGPEKVEVRAIGDLMNAATNQTKHGHGPVTFDAPAEAKEVLDRAVTNYYALMNYYPQLHQTELIGRFNREVIRAALQASSCSGP